MNVRELIELLEEFGGHLDVYGGDEDYYYTISLGTETVNGMTSVVIGLEDKVEEG